MMKRTLILAIAVLCTVALASTTQAGVISSSEFSLGYGFTGSWNTNETSGSNTPTVIDDFTFLPTLVGDTVSSHGPLFTDRVLVGGSSTGHCCHSNDTATKDGFGVSIAGLWAGDDPADAAADPDYHIQLNITSIRIWGGARNWGAETTAFKETTTGHEATSSYITIPDAVDGYKHADDYAQLDWDPVDYAAGGKTFAREFVLDTTGTSHRVCAVDGFEVFGTIDVTYNVIPEPSTFLLLGSGVIAALAMLRRRR